MKTRIALILLGLLWSQPLALAAAGSYEPQLPDLIVKDITFEQPSKVRLRIMNQGEGAAASCYVALQTLAGNGGALKTEQRVWTIQIPALEAGKGYSNVIDVSPLTRTNGPWKVTVDRSNFVKESNEDNNSFDYPRRNPGPVPPGYRRPDLVITDFDLTDPAQGLVTVEIANKGGGPAGPSTLRLIVWEQGKFEQKEAKTVFVKVRAIEAGGGVRFPVRTSVPIINTKYSMFIDISHEVAESNEDNNRAEGEAGNYKP
jgi:CARDB